MILPPTLTVGGFSFTEKSTKVLPTAVKLIFEYR